MGVPGTENAEPSSRLRQLPWVTHLVVAIGAFTWMVWSDIDRYGFDRTRTGPWSQAGLIDWDILVLAVVLVSPLAALEGWAAGAFRLRWVARGSAAAATVVVAWIGALPVVLRFFGDRAPVTWAEVWWAVSSYLVMLVGYLLVVVLFGILWVRRTGKKKLTTP